MSSIQHPLHEHDLSLRQLSEKCSVGCAFCGLDVHGPSYCCHDCDLFFHESCVDVPLEIQHPSHPQHPLKLWEWRPICATICGFCCETASESRLVYFCDDCRFVVDTACAALVFSNIQDQNSGSVQHFAHEHPLYSSNLNTLNRIKCRACMKPVSGPVIGCHGCVFVMHESCARFPEEIHHPFHSEHPLVLVADVKLFDCKACHGNISAGSAYRCDRCQFTLDFHCAVSTLPPQGLQDEDPVTINHFSHQHPLVSLNVTNENNISCKACDRNISGEVYCCQDCIFLIHKSCAELPRKMQHFLHPDHPLELIAKPLYGSGQFRCNCCQNSHRGFVFNCSVCEFDLDPECALQTLSAFNNGMDVEIQYFGHDHPLTLCFVKQNFCYACFKSVRGLSYGCLTCSQSQRECNFVLHESCAKKPRELEHPFHPLHPLMFLPEESDESGHCSACRRKSTNVIGCAKCEFYLDIECAMKIPDLKYHLHEHKLAYFSMTKYLECSSCYISCNTDMYRCVICNFNIHHDCLPLPATVKHELHIHPLALRDRYVIDYLADDDQYCDLCETLRNPDYGVYYCDECRCAAHISCVLPSVNSEGRKLAEDSKLEELDEKIANVEAEMEAVKKEMEKRLEVLTAKLKEFNIEREMIMNYRMQREFNRTGL